MLIILERVLDGIAVDAAGRVDFINCELDAVLNSQAIGGCAAGGGSDAADIPGLARCSGFTS